MLLALPFFFFGSYSRVSAKNSSGIFVANQRTDHHYLHYQIIAEKKYKEPRDFSLEEKAIPLFVIKVSPANLGTKSKTRASKLLEDINVLGEWQTWKGSGSSALLPLCTSAFCYFWAESFIRNRQSSIEREEERKKEWTVKPHTEVALRRAPH